MIIGNWDVSNVTNRMGMFYGASSFNQDLFNWDVSSVTDISRMFKYAENFNGISSWDVSNVQNMKLAWQPHLIKICQVGMLLTLVT